ncbi:MAG: hypothetical protein SGI97_06920 [candidate division Zixibacteria bacterium]|nr:hypothetical protein [candidate division Zixibacteria bacterium]
MPFCPSCSYEFEPTVGVCPDCGKTLVAQPLTPTVATSPDDSWVPVCALNGKLNAERSQAVLHSVNIPSMVSSIHLSGIQAQGIDSNGIDQSEESIVLMVPREFKEEALLALEGLLGKNYRHVHIKTV